MSNVINSLMPSAETLYFRTGYFFFSGYKEIYKNLKDKKIMILVGKEAQKDIAGVMQELNYKKLEGASKRMVRNDYFKSLTSNFGDSNEIDSRETAEAYKIFVEKIKDGSLEIRKTVEPDHSKVYVFENNKKFSLEGQFLGSVIKGSSNLSLSGLSLQEEDNELHKDNEQFKHYKNKFLDLWETSIPLVDKESYPEFENKVLKKIWVNQLPAPYHVFLRVLYEYFSIEDDEDIITPAKITKNKQDLKYQIDAIRQSIDIISKHNGVIIADVVGLGKSIIGSCVAKNLDMKTVIIAPPHLKKQWEDYRYEFRFNAKVYGSGSVEKALYEDDGEQKLIIVDEAHKFRNEEKDLYANLHKLCQGNKVMLLTATPFNNDPKDIFSLIKLFQIPAKSTLQTIDNLSLRFNELVSEYKKIKKLKKEKAEEKIIKTKIDKLALHIKDLLGPLLIRRSRLDLMSIDEYREDLEAQNIKFPEVLPPKALEYSFGDLNNIYLKTLQNIVPEDMESGFSGARYNVAKYINDEQKIEKIARDINTDVNLVKNSQENLAKFMKRLLVHRFESSIEAFRKTLDNMIGSYEKIEKWYEKGQVPIYKKGDLPDVEDFYYDGDGDETIEKIDEIFTTYEEKGLELIDIKDLNNNFIIDLRSDIALLKEIKAMWSNFDPKKDPKIAKIKTEIKKSFEDDPERKIVIFSIYSDTTNYLYEQIKDEYRVFKYSAKDSSEKNKQIISANFDAGALNQENEFDILVATDAISEGYNLHRAGIIFNYDIPYNPTRVIQRVGRINRINKKVYEKIHIYNFFPSPTGETETGVRRIATLKIDVIKSLLGDDTKYLSVDEIVKSYNDEFEAEMKMLDDRSWDYKYKNLIKSLEKSDDFNKSMEIAMRTKIKRKIKKDQKGVIVFGKKGADYAFKMATDKGEMIQITVPEAMRIFEAEKDEKSEKISENFYDTYETIKKNLFTRKSEVPKDRGLRQAIEKVSWLNDNMPEYSEYFEDLEYVIKDLGALPGKYAKTIRAISKENVKEDVANLKSEVPHDYLIKMIEGAESIGEGAESLILAEEL